MEQRIKHNKTEDVLKQLEDGISAVFESDNYIRYLDTMSKFPNYSVNNCILIAMQRPNASYVAGYKTWQEKFHRHVLEGESGIKIIAPVTVKKSIEVDSIDEKLSSDLDQTSQQIVEPKEVTYQRFKTITVFDVSQTEGEPLPSLVSDLMDPVQDYEEYFSVIKDLSPVPVRFDNIDSGAKGYYSPQKQEIVLQRGLSEEQTIKTLLHECAHARLGHGNDDQSNRRTHEVQAESVAYCCCRAIGLDTSGYSFGYIAGWSSGKDQKELKASLQIIHDQADQMIGEIQEKLSHVMEIRTERTAMETPKIQETMKLSI